MSWEYKRCQINFTDGLNQLSEDGWEQVDVYVDDADKVKKVLFRRWKKEPLDKQRLVAFHIWEEGSAHQVPTQYIDPVLVVRVDEGPQHQNSRGFMSQQARLHLKNGDVLITFMDDVESAMKKLGFSTVKH